MGEYTVTPAATVNTDINSWAATYTGQIQYTIASGPSASTAATNSSAVTSGGTLISTQDLSYNGALQTVSVPSGTKYAVITAAGGGGGGGEVSNTYGGGGDLVAASVPINSSSLTVLVGGGGQTPYGSGGGGGLSGVFVGTPSDADALIIAGGGGGGANDNLQNTQSNGTDGSLSPILPYSGGDGLSGGAGFGGGGLGDQNAGNDGTPFGTGGVSTGSLSGSGGFGGGASGGNFWGGGGGGSGYVGGQGGNSWLGSGADNGSGGEGGQSYVISKATHVQDSPGNGGIGGYGAPDTNGYIAPGGNGYVDISFYS